MVPRPAAGLTRDPPALALGGAALRRALRTAAAEGASFLPRALDEGFLERLLAELSRPGYVRAPERVGPVRQETEALELAAPFDGFPHAARLATALGERVRGDGRGIRGLATWRPNEVTVQRYAPGSIGVTPHLDGKRFRRLVAVFTLDGRAAFRVHRARDAPPDATWKAGPGDLVLLRGPGLAGHRDGRPFHSIGGPVGGPRMSLGLRMDASRRRPATR